MNRDSAGEPARFRHMGMDADERTSLQSRPILPTIPGLGGGESLSFTAGSQ